MTDIIGTPVERVIPEGWSVVREKEVGAGDAMESNGKWVELVFQERREKTDANGRLWGTHLVIRRNAPEPSIEELKAKVAELEKERNTAIVDAAEQRVRAAELEKVVKNLQDEDYRNTRDYNAQSRHIADLTMERDNLRAKVAERDETIRWYKQLHAADKAKVAELEKEAEKWKGEWTLARNKHQGALDAKDAEIERLTISAADLLARNADLADEVEKWEGRCDDAEAKDVKIKQLNADVTMWADASQRNLKRADDAEAKLYAVKKAMEGA